MKKYFAIAAAVCAALVTMSCQKNDDGKGDEAKVSKRVATFSLVGDGWADVYQFTYDNDKVVKVFREEGKEWSLTYSDKNVKIVGKDVNYDCALNDMGFVSTLTDEWGDTFAFTYDKEGRITKPVVCWCIGTCATMFSSEVQPGQIPPGQGGQEEAFELGGGV